MDPDVIKEVKDAYATLPNQADENNTAQDVMLAYNQFAFCFARINDKSIAKELFTRIGVEYSENPWSYPVDDPAEGYLEYRRRVGLGMKIPSIPGNG